MIERMVGTIQNAKLHHKGSLFHVYRAQLVRNKSTMDVCLKIPSVAPKKDVVMEHSYSNTTHFFHCKGGLASHHITPIHLAYFLWEEAKIIVARGKHWNHAIMGVGVWKKDGTIRYVQDPEHAQPLLKRAPPRLYVDYAVVGWSLLVHDTQETGACALSENAAIHLERVVGTCPWRSQARFVYALRRRFIFSYP